MFTCEVAALLSVVLNLWQAQENWLQTFNVVF